MKGASIELRHLRFFVAVVEEGSFTAAAEHRLHTAQPSLSRQIRDLEYEVGTPLLLRNARGVEPTSAGRAFLEHARLALAQVDAGIVSARRAAAPTKPVFALGFLTGHEIVWLPQVMRTMREELPSIEVSISSQPSPDLGEALVWGKLDLAFMRIEPKFSELSFKSVGKEPIVVVLPSDHALAKQEEIDVRQLEDEVLIGVGGKATVLHDVIEQYLANVGHAMPDAHAVDNLAMGISLVASTRGVALLPRYVESLMPWSVVSRPLTGVAPTIDLAVAYRSDNQSPLLAKFLSKLDDLIERVESWR